MDRKIEWIRQFAREHQVQVFVSADFEVAILRGGLQYQIRNEADKYMRSVVREFAGNDHYSEYIEVFLDNPWVRVLLFDNSHYNEKQCEGYSIFTKQLTRRSHIDILVGGIGSLNPDSYMALKVADYVGHELHNEFIKSTRDLPWVRVILFGINELPYVE